VLNCVYYLQLLLFFCYLPSGVFRRKATVRWPPLSPDHENFLRRLYMKRCVFCRFPARIAKLNNVWWSFYNMRLKSPCEIASDMMLWFSAFPNFRKNGRICSFHWTFRSKVFQLQGSFAPLTPRPGALPLDPRYRLALCMLAIAPPLCQILNTPLYLPMRPLWCH